MRFLRRVWRFIVISVALVALTGIAWARYEAGKAKDFASAPRARRHGHGVPVRTALVSDKHIETVIGATAVTMPSARVSIRFGTGSYLNQLNTVLRAVHVHNGMNVKADDLLFEFETKHFENNMTQKRQALKAAQAEVARAQAAKTENAATRQVELEAAASELEFRRTDVDYRRDDHDRLLELRKNGHASFTEYLEAASAYAEARYRLTLATYRDRVAKAEMVLGPLSDQRDIETAAAQTETKRHELALAEDGMNRCQVRSPLNGYVDQVTVAPGQVVDTKTTLAEVLQIDPIHVLIDFPQERIGELVIGQSAEVVLDAFSKETFAGLVVRISARVDENNRVLPVVVEVPNPNHRIKVGLSGYVRIHVSGDATTVPAIAVIGVESEAMAFVVEDGRANIRRIRTGPVVETGFREVLDGLAAGDEVVIYGQQYLRDGEPVNTNWRQWARRD